MNSLTLTEEQLRQMIAHASQQAPLEACGLLAGRGSKVEQALEATNQARSASRFVMDPIEQLKAFEWMESSGLDLIGIYHSHPAGPETVSPTDIAESAYEVVHVILAPVGGRWQARGFWIADGTFDEVALRIE
jgi:proteasome lid subunit RPN8/RPN11